MNLTIRRNEKQRVYWIAFIFLCTVWSYATLILDPYNLSFLFKRVCSELMILVFIFTLIRIEKSVLGHCSKNRLLAYLFAIFSMLPFFIIVFLNLSANSSTQKEWSLLIFAVILVVISVILLLLSLVLVLKDKNKIIPYSRYNPFVINCLIVLQGLISLGPA